MKSKYSFIPLKTIEMYMPLIVAENVSIRARSPNQFLDQYKKFGKLLPHSWLKKRENFITRHIIQYRQNPTVRRRLAIIVWAHDPEYP